MNKLPRDDKINIIQIYFEYFGENLPCCNDISVKNIKYTNWDWWVKDTSQEYTTLLSVKLTLCLDARSILDGWIYPRLVLTPDYNSPECNKNANRIFGPEIQFTCITKPGDQWCCPPSRDYRTNFSLSHCFSDYCSYSTQTTTTAVEPSYNMFYHDVIS